MSQKLYHALIIGAGPVGLFLGCCLHHFGLSFMILERRKENRGNSRAIGIHPPSLELFQRLGLIDRLLAKGVRVTGGKAYTGQKLLGEISFADLPPPYNFVLTVPQYETEKILEDHLNAVVPGCIKRDSHVESFVEHEGRMRVVARLGSPATTELTGLILVGSDGKNSAVREKSHIEFEGGQYDDAFVMGDFDDATNYGNEARIFMDERGFIESFPLPGKIRRWVMQTDTLLAQPDESSFVREIEQRTGTSLAGSRTSLISPFGIHHYIASTFVKGRVVLAGDAAHVISPIGGQGMNVGWMDALDVAGALHHVVQAKIPAEIELAAYNDKARVRARKAIDRSEIYMAIGRKTKLPWLKNLGLKFALKMPGKNLAAQFFTMRGL